MPKKRSTRADKKRLKSKSWYSVYAPSYLEGAKIGDALAKDPDSLIGRVIKTSLQEIVSGVSKPYLSMFFKISRYEGDHLNTDFIGHEISRSYISRLSRKKHSKIDVITDCKTQDDHKIRLKTLVITGYICNNSVARAIFHETDTILRNRVEGIGIDEFVRLIISDSLQKEVARQCKNIYPLKRVEVRASEVG